MKRALSFAVLLVCVVGAAASRLPQSDTGPIVSVETTRGRFDIQTYPNEAPRTVAHILALVKRGFYDGLRVHRALPGFVVQFGDPQTRDVAKRSIWGRGPDASSGSPIGAAEMSKKRLNVKGAVGIAHQGVPSGGDSQIYIALADRPDLDGKYAVFGGVIAGDDVPAQLQVGDQIIRVSVRP